MEISTKDPKLVAVRITRNGETYQIPMRELRKQTDLQNLTLQNGDSIISGVSIPYLQPDLQSAI